MKIVMVSIAFAPARVIIECYKQVYKTIGNIQFEHYVLNNHYPDQEKFTDDVVKILCKHRNIKYFDLGENVGLSAGYNHLLNNIDLQDDDIVIGVDPDTWPVTQGWGEALVKVLSEPNTTIGWASLFTQHTQREFNERGYTKLIINGINCNKVNQAMLNSICAWKGKMLKEMKGLHEPRKFYGGFESMSYPIIKNLGFDWVFLPDYSEEFNDLVKADKFYTVYKYDYVHGKTSLSFAEWLEEDPKRLNLK
jgi:GT2 family glycosyltransferase